MNSYILGVSYGYHDSANSLLHDGNIIAAVQEERFTRIKQDARFPRNSIRFCLREAGIGLNAVDAVYYYENPDKKFDRIAQVYLNFGLRGRKSFMQEMPDWLFNKRFVKRELKRELQGLLPTTTCMPRLEYVDHHESHAAAAFFQVPSIMQLCCAVHGWGRRMGYYLGLAWE